MNDKSLLLAPSYVRDIHVSFGEAYKDNVSGDTRKKVTIELEINPEEATHLRNMPGMDDQQFIAFLSPCLQVSLYKTLSQGMGHKNQVIIEEKSEDKCDWNDVELY